jgi:ubiquinone/menaquinone biosynthesis C-methylase UbiE
MERLARTSELMDGPLDDRVALATNLRDLRRVNRMLGGTDLSRRALAVLAGTDRRPLTILDVGTGAADIPAALIADAAQQGVSLRVTALDSRPEMLQTAVATRPGLATIASLRLRVGDGRRLADADREYDIAHSSMVIHHLEPDEAVTFLREMGRVAGRGVIVNDLIRSRLNWVGAWLISHLLTASRYTRHDAPLSVRRAYTLVELEALVERAGLRPVATIRGRFGHRYAIAAIAEPIP